MPLDLDDIADAIRTGIYGDDRATGEEVGAALNALHTLLDEVRRVQSGGCARDQRTTQFCAEAVAKDADIQRLASELATSHADIQRLWVEIDWQVHRTVLRATVGVFRLDVSRDGWELKIRGMSMDYYWVASGPETGIDGQRAAEAAYRRVVGPPCP